MKPTRLAPLLLLPIALAACGGDAADLPAAGPAAPVVVAEPPAPVTTPAAPATTPATRPTRKTTAKPKPKRTASATPAKPRPRPVLAPRAEVAGASDSLSTGRWTLRVTLAGGDVVTGAIQAEPQLRPRVLGVVDADRDSDFEVFVAVGGGASTTTYAVFTLVEDGMAEVRDAQGRPLRLVVGGSVTHGDGFVCDGRSLAVLSVVSDDGQRFRGTTVTYAWRGDVVTETARGTFTGSAGDPAVRAAYGVDCGSMQQSG